MTGAVKFSQGFTTLGPNIVFNKYGIFYYEWSALKGQGPRPWSHLTRELADPFLSHVSSLHSKRNVLPVGVDDSAVSQPR